MSTKMVALAAAALVSAASAARADLIYSLDIAPTFVGDPSHGGPLNVATIDLTDAQVASGSFTLRGTGSGGEYNGEALFGYEGDTAGFVTATLATEPVTPSYLYGSVTINLTFGSNDGLSTVYVNYLGVGNGVVINGFGGSSSVTFGSDDPYLCPTNSNGQTQFQCSFNAISWTVTPTDPLAAAAVPEPATLAVLGVGLLGLAGLRRQSIACLTGRA